MKRSRPEKSEDQLVVWAAAKLVERARAIAPDYASRGVQAGTHMVSRLLTQTGCFLTTEELSEGVSALVTPPIDGVNIIVLNSRGGMDHGFGVRHELGHRLAGDVDELTFLDSRSEAWSERVADLFALADLVPGGEIARLRRLLRLPWKDVVAGVQEWAEMYGGAWEPARLRDRARLRVMLWRTHGM